MTRTPTTTRRRPLTSELATSTQLDPVTVDEAAAVLADALQPLTNRQILDEVCWARGLAPQFGQYGDPWPLSKITAALAALVADGRAVLHQGAPNPVYLRLDDEQMVGVYGSSPTTRWYTRPDLDTALRAHRDQHHAAQDAQCAEAQAVVDALDAIPGAPGTLFDLVNTGPEPGQLQVRLTPAQARALFAAWLPTEPTTGATR